MDKMDKRNQALFIDLDGTILDSVQESRKRIIKLAESCSLPVEPDIEDKIKIGWKKSLGKHDFAESIWPEETPGKLLAFMNAWEAKDSSESYDIFPDTKEALEKLYKYFFLGILTNRHRSSAFSQIRKNDLMPLFDLIVTPDWTRVRKPDPKMMEPVFKKCEQLKIHRKNIILVGDTIEEDWLLAKALGLKFYAVLAGGINTKEEFVEAGVPENNIIASVANLPAILLQKA